MLRPFTLKISSRILPANRPLVMGIFNATPDSFYAASRMDGKRPADRLAVMIEEGADIIDIGGCSTRPGAPEIDIDTEWQRVKSAITEARRLSDDAIISIDTYRAEIARRAVDSGADIINDISAGTMDKLMVETVSMLKVPYIIMHTRATPADMQSHTDYPDGVISEVIKVLSERIRMMRLAGVADIIADPGLGFAKTVQQNYEILAQLQVIAGALEVPILVGLSRKSMITRLLDISAEEALPATMALNTVAVLNGASIIRVHDVKAGVEAIKLAQAVYGECIPMENL